MCELLNKKRCEGSNKLVIFVHNTYTLGIIKDLSKLLSDAFGSPWLPKNILRSQLGEPEVHVGNKAGASFQSHRFWLNAAALENM